MQYLRKGKGMEYLFHWPPEDSSSEPPLKHLEWAGLGVQTAQRAIIGVPASYRSYRCDTPPALTVVHGKAKEIEAVERTLLTGHTRSDLR